MSEWRERKHWPKANHYAFGPFRENGIVRIRMKDGREFEHLASAIHWQPRTGIFKTETVMWAMIPDGSKACWSDRLTDMEAAIASGDEGLIIYALSKQTQKDPTP